MSNNYQQMHGNIIVNNLYGTGKIWVFEDLGKYNFRFVGSSGYPVSGKCGYADLFALPFSVPAVPGTR